MDAQQKFHHDRRRAQQFLNAAVIRFNVGINQRTPEHALRAAQDMAQAVDELLELVGAPAVSGPVDCPDCGQVLDDITEDEQNYLDGRGEL